MNHKPRVMYCPNCKKNNRTHNSSMYVTSAAYYSAYINKEEQTCQYCGCTLLPMNIDVFEFGTIVDISGDPSFIEAMDDLKQKDPIEFQLKMSQFKTQLQQQESSKQTEEDNTPHCPTCGSTDIQKISGTKRWLSTGLFGLASSDIGKSMCCKKCGYKW